MGKKILKNSFQSKVSPVQSHNGKMNRHYEVENNIAFSKADLIFPWLGELPSIMEKSRFFDMGSVFIKEIV